MFKLFLAMYCPSGTYLACYKQCSFLGQFVSSVSDIFAYWIIGAVILKNNKTNLVIKIIQFWLFLFIFFKIVIRQTRIIIFVSGNLSFPKKERKIFYLQYFIYALKIEYLCTASVKCCQYLPEMYIWYAWIKIVSKRKSLA